MSADGYARAEGVAAVLIKRLDVALTDGDSIYSIIKGSAINANGKGKSLTMPEGNMQAETIKEAYRIAKRDPSEAFFVELHATGEFLMADSMRCMVLTSITGTKVGDPIETNAAGKVFSKGRDAQKSLRYVRSMISFRRVANGNISESEASRQTSVTPKDAVS